MRGATSMSHLELEGEHYLAVAQGVCDLYLSPSRCVEDSVTQPQVDGALSVCQLDVHFMSIAV